MIKLLTQKRYRCIIIGIVLLLTVTGIFLRAKWRMENELWVDEVYQIKPMKESLYATIIHTRRNMQFPGDYVLVYPFYRWFGENKWGLAIPHIGVTIIGFYLLFVLCRKYFKTLGGYMVAFMLFTYNYNLINHAFEIRPYSVLVTLAIGVFLALQYIFEQERVSLIKRIFISMFIFVTILFHIFGAYILVFSYIFHLLFSRKGKKIGGIFKKHLKYYSPALILALLVLYRYIAGAFIAPVDKIVNSNTFEFIGKGVIPVFKGVFGNLTGSRRFYVLLVGILINFIIPHKERLEQMMFFAILIVAPIALVLLGCIHFHYWFIQRLFIWAVPLFCFFLGWCWDSIIVYFAGKIGRYRAGLLSA